MCTRFAGVVHTATPRGRPCQLVHAGSGSHFHTLRRHAPFAFRAGPPAERSVAARRPGRAGAGAAEQRRAVAAGVPAAVRRGGSPRGRQALSVPGQGCAGAAQRGGQRAGDAGHAGATPHRVHTHGARPGRRHRRARVPRPRWGQRAAAGAHWGG
eukprot:364209-Chlamydomonas_euryale.AAC.16